MPLYETTFITRPEISAQDAEKIGNDFADIIKENGGKIIKREYWGLRSLTYKVKKANRGHYVMFGVEMPGNAVKELERKYKIHEDIIRSLTVQVDKIQEGQSAILRPSSNDNESGEQI